MLHDVLRFIVRGGPRVPVNVKRALMMLDGDEQGFKTVEEYEAHLATLTPPQRLPRSNQEANELLDESTG